MSKPYKNTYAEKDLLTVSEAASLLRVTPTTIRNWDKSGKLPSQRDPQNSYRLYSISDLTKLGDLKNKATFIEEERKPKTHLDPSKAGDFRNLVKQMSKAFRDSNGASIMERFEQISKILFLKMYDEKNDNLLKKEFLTDEDIYSAAEKIYIAALSDLALTTEITAGPLSPDKQAVTQIIKLLGEISLLEIPSDIKGVVFEELVKNTFDKTDNQQFFTPRAVVNFIVSMVGDIDSKTVMDPACGTGGFLTGILDREPTSNTKLVGLEIDQKMALITQMNLLIHGHENNEVHAFSKGGSLSRDGVVQEKVPDGSVDVIVTNPPFGSDFTDITQLKKYDLGKDRKSRRRGVLFIERCVSWLKPMGKLAIIIDDSVLNSNSNVDVRNFISKHCHIDAIVSLPTSAFQPYANVQSSILFLTKKLKSENQKEIFMAKASTVGRKPNGDMLYGEEFDNNGHPILLSDLPEIMEDWNRYTSTTYTPNKENIYTIPAQVFADKDENKDFRFDVHFHNPSKRVAKEVLNQSAEPVTKLSELVSVRNISTIPQKDDPDEIYNYVGLANIASHTGEYSPVPTTGSQIKSAVKLFKPGDILFSKLRPELKKVVLVSQEDAEGHASSECYVLTPNDKIDNEYLSLILKSDIVYGQLVYKVSGVGRPRINIGAVLETLIPLPDIQKQKEIVKQLRKIETARKEVESRIRADQLEVKNLISSVSDQFKEHLIRS